MSIQPGIYESLLTPLLEKKLNEAAHQYYVHTVLLDASEAAEYLSRYMSHLLQYTLKQFSGEQQIQRQIAFCNELVSYLAQQLQEDDDTFIAENLLHIEGKLLQAVVYKLGYTDKQLANQISNTFPNTGLTFSSLFTGSNADLQVDAELKKDILTADRIYWIVSFIRWSGIRIFEEELRAFTEQEGKQLHIITTSYMGATEPRAIEFLASLPNTQIKISYNTSHERLHAKSYLFERDSDFDTAYIGSSNLSYSALTKGLEWNMRVTKQENPHIWKKAKGTFETYWQHPDFEDFTEGGIEKLRQALLQAKGIQNLEPGERFDFDLHPYTYQLEVLNRLQAERDIHHRFRNLVVAATGTGKTMIAAFDYQRMRKQQTPSRLLFVAHRKEILEQARRTFRAVLKEPNFGELWVGEHRPVHQEHLFISVQTLNSQKDFFQDKTRFPADYYQMIILDEAHHGAANSYRFLLDYFQPKILLGLTATPERMDGEDIRRDFDHRTAAEIRLPDALKKGLLAPFQYFCVTDDTVNLSDTWQNGRYDRTQLSNLYTGNHLRTDLILRSLQHYLADIHTAKALCFCTTQQHAEFMAQRFIQKGLRADYIVSDSTSAEKRRKIRQDLKSGTLNYVFVVDIFNEGVDIPEIDTVLFLRPTESLTIFLQQLGRGLRLSEGKECLTVLDFVGQAHQQYNFAEKFRALTGKTNHNISKEIEEGFPHLPFGCSIKMEKQAQEYILSNIQKAIYNKRRLVQEVNRFQQYSNLPLTLANFLEFLHIELRDFYKYTTWNHLRQDAGIISLSKDPLIDKIQKGIARWVYLDSLNYILFIERLAAQQFAFSAVQSSPQELQWARMLYYDIWGDTPEKCGFSSIAAGIEQIGQYPACVEEIQQLIGICKDRIAEVPESYTIGSDCTLDLHAQYSRDQLLAAFGEHNETKKASSREGVYKVWSANVEMLFVTLNKTDKNFSESTMYNDYAISEKLFHWETQNSAAPHTKAGLSYIHHAAEGKNILLFVRTHNKDEYGNTLPYYFLGPVQYRKHTGARPMGITWELDTPILPLLLGDAAKMRIG